MPSPLPFELPGFLETTMVLFTILTARYFCFAGAFYWLFYKRGVPSARKLRAQNAPKERMQKEIGWSLVTSAIFAVSGAVLLHAWNLGYLRIYLKPDEYGWAWLLLSLPCLMLLHETYFYWTHRWIHHPALFRRVHLVHHESHNPTPWAAFSFHPWEALIQAIVLPGLVWLVPTHLAVLLVFLMGMTVLGVINHLGYEMYPRRFETSSFGRQIINATHHSLHHARFRGNYGLYFTFWDRWMRTETPDTNAIFYPDSSIERPGQSPSQAA